jgi:hypothetical protein
MSSSDNNDSATSNYSDILNALDNLEVWDWCGSSHDYPRYAHDYHGNTKKNIVVPTTNTDPIDKSDKPADNTTDNNSTKFTEAIESSSTADPNSTKSTKPTESPTTADDKNTQATKETKQPPRLGPCGNPLTTFSMEDPCLRSDKCMEGKELDEGAKKTAEQIKAKGTRVSVVNGIFH